MATTPTLRSTLKWLAALGSKPSARLRDPAAGAEVSSALARGACRTHMGRGFATTWEGLMAAGKVRAVGFNHVALEVGDIDAALEFYGRLFEFKLRGRSTDAAFIDLGDQFLALQKGRKQGPDDGRHFGLVVD